MVGVSIRPAFGSAPDVSLADPAAATASAASPVDSETVWTPDGRGRWRLDGRDTAERDHPTP
jgi:hypothetical protein